MFIRISSIIIYLPGTSRGLIFVTGTTAFLDRPPRDELLLINPSAPPPLLVFPLFLTFVCEELGRELSSTVPGIIRGLALSSTSGSSERTSSLNNALGLLLEKVLGLVLLLVSSSLL